MRRTTIYSLSFFYALLLWLSACSGSHSHSIDYFKGDTAELRYARFLTMEHFPEFTRAVIRNPWDSLKTLHTYIIVPDSMNLPPSLPEGTIVRTPLKNSLVYSSIHMSLFEEFGTPEAVRGVCDAAYITNPVIQRQLDEGITIDCGTNGNPDIEKIISINPDAILLSPYQNSGSYGKLGQTAIPIIECADYMETSPLGRAEWIKFYGLLIGAEQEAIKRFERTEDAYHRLTALASEAPSKPKILADLIYGNSWYVPGAGSVTDRLLSDAGADNPFSAYTDGITPLSAEQVLLLAGDADLWIIRYAQTTDKTLSELKKDNPIYERFRPLRMGNVLGCNTKSSLYYDDIPFNPDWLLADLIRVIHPSLGDSIISTHCYFTPLRP